MKEEHAKFMEPLVEYVRGSKLAHSLAHAPVVAVLNGPAVCIEVIVRKAEAEAGFPMDWGYAGGRGYVHSLGDRTKARRALYLSMPQSDLTQADL